MIAALSIAGAIIATTSAALLLKYRDRMKKSIQPSIAELKMKCESPIEEKLFYELIRRDIIPEPQYVIDHYRLDFAISPDHLKINIECDGKDYHDFSPQIEQDRRRNTYLASKGWAVLRFSGSQINRDVHHCGNIVNQTIRTRERQLNKVKGKRVDIQ